MSTSIKRPTASSTPAEVQPEEVKKPAPSQEATASNVGQELLSDIERTKVELEKQDKIMFYIPLSPGEKAGVAEESVTINGYRVVYKKGQTHMMPRAHVEQLSAYLNIDMSEFAQGIRADRDEVKEGVSVSEALS